VVAVAALPPLVLAAHGRWPVVIPASLPVAFLAAGAFALHRAPDNRAALGLAALGSCHLIGFALSPVALLIEPRAAAGVIAWVGSLFYNFGFVAWILLLGTYPDGRYERHYERRVVGIAATAFAVLGTLGALAKPDLPLPVTSRQVPLLHSPVHVSALKPVADGVPLLINIAMVAGVVLLVRANRTELPYTH
jgi:hypothetical protein